MTEKTALQAQRLVAAQGAATLLRCPATLMEVTDARPAGESAGMFGNRELRFEGAAPLIKDQLLASGLTEGKRSGAMEVVVRLKRLYMSQQHGINTPVVVLEVTVDQTPPVLIRPRTPSVNWWGSEEELYEDLGAAVTWANREVIAGLNARCGASPVPAR
ncbi:MAG: hypothetical protein QM795_09395 [Pseudoxanthomonas sp.]